MRDETTVPPITEADLNDAMARETTLRYAVAYLAEMRLRREPSWWHRMSSVFVGVLLAMSTAAIFSALALATFLDSADDPNSGSDIGINEEFEFPTDLPTEP